MALFILIITANISEASFILQNEGIISEKTATKIEEIGKEVKDKLGISVYISAKRNLGNKHITEYGKELSTLIEGSYAILTFAEFEKKVDIVSSSDVEKLFNKNKVLNDYTIPILVAIDKNTENSKYNAGLLNGYSELAEEIAKNKGISLVSALGNSSSNVVLSLRVVIYGFLFLMGIYYLYRMFIRRDKNV